MKAVFLSSLLISFSASCFANTKIEIPSGTLTLIHNRPDISLKQIMMQVGCFSQKGQQVTCKEITVNGTETGASGIDAPAVSPIQAKFPKIEVSIDEAAGETFCVGMKALFNGFPNECDSILYPPYPDRRHRDRYSILSYCSAEKMSSGMDSRFGVRRIADWEDYLFLLKQPIPLELTSASQDQCVIPDPKK